MSGTQLPKILTPSSPGTNPATGALADGLTPVGYSLPTGGAVPLVVLAGAEPGSVAPVNPLASVNDNADNVAASAVANAVKVMARLTGYDSAGNNWDRLRSTLDNADAQAALGANGVLATVPRPYVWNGATYDRLRALSAANLAALSGIGGLVVAGPGEWAIQHQPAAATQATISRAAVANTRHVCRSITVSIAAVAAQGIIRFNLRDGATGAGTILWSLALVVLAGDSKQITLGDLNIVGSVNTAMTLESDAAPAATNFATVALTGYDAA